MPPDQRSTPYRREDRVAVQPGRNLGREGHTVERRERGFVIKPYLPTSSVR
jgi:hypothetical protein